MQHHQLAQALPGVRQDFALSAADFNYWGSLPASTLIRYASDCRLIAFATWPALARMVSEDVGAHVTIKAQLIRFLRPNRSHPGAILGVTQKPHVVGSTSLTLAYEFHDDDSGEAFAQVLTVCIRVKDGRSMPLPEYVAEELVWQHKATELEDTKDIVLLSTAIEQAKHPTSVSKNARLTHEVLVRPSDVDVTKSVSGHRMMQYFEDAISGNKEPDLIYIDFLGELKAKSRCDVFGVPNNENGGQEMISFLIERETNQTIARSYVSWASKSLKMN